MAELSEADLIAKISALDTQIASITTAIAAGGTGAAQFTNYSIGSLSVSGSQHLSQLRETRQMYQEMLDKMPKEVNDVASYDVNVAGEDDSDLLGDE